MVQDCGKIVKLFENTLRLFYKYLGLKIDFFKKDWCGCTKFLSVEIFSKLVLYVILAS
jgi:hypothetical protein